MSIYSAYVLTALTAVVQPSSLSYGSSSSSSSQGIFHMVNSTDGVTLCSVDTPQTIFNAKQLFRSFADSTCVPVPLRVLCAWKCSTSGSCSSFNWKANSQLCELYIYNSSSGVCAIVKDCFYYQRSDFHGNCSLKSMSQPTDGEILAPQQESISNSTNDVANTTQLPSATGSIGPTYLVQRNVNGSNFFQKRLWDEYAKGFGRQEDNFWMGNDQFHQLTVDFNCSIAFNLEIKRLWYTFSYPSVTLTNASDGYRLYMSGSMSGNTSYGFSNQNGKMFSTYDKDNDQSSAFHCGQVFGVGWWYVNLQSLVTGVNCGVSNLNANSTYFYFYNNEYVPVQSSSIWITCT